MKVLYKTEDIFTFHPQVENIGLLRSCLVCGDTLVIPNVFWTKVVDEQSLVQQMNI